jgi:hypothetical protein
MKRQILATWTDVNRLIKDAKRTGYTHWEIDQVKSEDYFSFTKTGITEVESYSKWVDSKEFGCKVLLPTKYRTIGEKIVGVHIRGEHIPAECTPNGCVGRKTGIKMYRAYTVATLKKDPDLYLVTLVKE